MNSKSVLFIALFCLVLYVNSLGGGFVWDDQAFVVGNIHITTLANPGRFFTDYRTGATKQMASDVYRPITAISYAIDYLFWNLNSFGYHLTNILLHSANSICVFLLLSLLCGDFFTAFFGSLLFASHPVQTEVVCWISGRSSLLFLLFYLLSFIFYIRYARDKKRELFASSMIFFALSLFSKEMSVTLPLILILYDIHFPDGKRFRTKASRYIPYFALALFYIVLRVALLKKVGQFEGWGNPYFTFLTMSKVVVDYIRLLIFPAKLCAVGYAIPAAVSIKDVSTFLSVAALFSIIAGIPLIFKRHKIASFSVLFFFITLLPVLNIIPIKALEADRFLYLPSIGFCILLAAGVSALWGRMEKPVAWKTALISAAAVLLIMVCSVKTFLRTEVWKSEIDISREAVKVSPTSACALTALGGDLIERDEYEAALEPLEKAVSLSGNYGLAREALGACYIKLGRYKEAAEQLRVAVKEGPNIMSSRNRLGVVYSNLKEYDKAEEQFNIVLKEDPEFVNAYLNMGRMYELRNDYKSALRQYLNMLQHIKEVSSEAVVYIRIGDAYVKMDYREKAKAAYLRAGKAAAGSAMLEKIIEDKLNTL